MNFQKMALTMIAAAGLAVGIAAPANAEISAKDKAAIDAFYGAFNTKDLGKLDAAVSANWDDLPLAPHQGPGREGFKPTAQYFFTAFPDLHVTNEQIVADGNMVVVRSTLSGTQRGEFSGMAPSGKPFSIMVMDMHQMQDGKIIRTWHVENWLGMMFATGAWPAKK
jgi:predicted ester cyclase